MNVIMKHGFQQCLDSLNAKMNRKSKVWRTRKIEAATPAETERARSRAHHLRFSGRRALTNAFLVSIDGPSALWLCFSLNSNSFLPFVHCVWAQLFSYPSPLIITIFHSRRDLSLRVVTVAISSFLDPRAQTLIRTRRTILSNETKNSPAHPTLLANQTIA